MNFLDETDPTSLTILRASISSLKSSRDCNVVGDFWLQLTKLGLCLGIGDRVSPDFVLQILKYRHVRHSHRREKSAGNAGSLDEDARFRASGSKCLSRGSPCVRISTDASKVCRECSEFARLCRGTNANMPQLPITRALGEQFLVSEMWLLSEAETENNFLRVGRNGISRGS